MTVYKPIKRGQRSSNFSYSFVLRHKKYRGVCKNCTTKQEALVFEAKIRAEIESLSIGTSVPEVVTKYVAQKVNVAPTQLVKAVELTFKNPDAHEEIQLEQAYETSLKQCYGQKASEAHIQRYTQYFNDFVQFMHAFCPNIEHVNEVKKEHAIRYIDYLTKNGPYITEITQMRVVGNKRPKTKVMTYDKKRQLSPKSINERHSCLRTAFKRLAEVAQLMFNPFEFKMKSNDSSERETFTNSEIALLLEHASMPILKPIILTSICTGLSLKDIAMLRWDEIRNGFIVRKRCKTKVEIENPILPQLQEMFDSVEHVNDSPYVFDELYRLYEHSAPKISEMFKTFAESLGITVSADVGIGNKRPKKTIHSLRHTFAYALAEANTPSAIAQALMAHKTGKMTQHYQAHATRHTKQQFIEKLGEAIPALEQLQSQSQTEVNNEHTL